MKKRIIITDLSRMGGGRVCIFGIDADGTPMRPEISRSGIQESYLLNEKGQFIAKPFAEIEFDFIRSLPKPPHIEDWEINKKHAPRLIRNLPENERKKFVEGLLEDSVNEIFGTEIRENRYIDKINQSRCNKSIGTIKVKVVQRVSYSIYEGKYKYRITFSDSNGEIYDLPVTDCAFRKHCDKKRIQKQKCMKSIGDELQQKFNQIEVFLRVGLARPFLLRENRCYLQISGIHTFPDYTL